MSAFTTLSRLTFFLKKITLSTQNTFVIKRNCICHLCHVPKCLNNTVLSKVHYRIRFRSNAKHFLTVALKNRILRRKVKTNMSKQPVMPR